MGGSIPQRARLRRHLPFVADRRVQLASAAEPPVIGARGVVPPKGVDVRKRAVALGRYLNTDGLAVIVDQGSSPEELVVESALPHRIEPA